MAARTAKDIDEQFLDDPQLVEPIEAFVKGEDGPRSLHAITRQPELVHGMDVADLELDRGSSGRRTSPAHPQVGVHPLATFQEQNGRAGAHLSNVIDGLGHAAAEVGSRLAGIELGLLLGVRDEGAQIFQQMTVASRHAAAAQSQAALLVVIPAVRFEVLDGHHRCWN